jgi:hypothetical protein
VGIPAQEIGVNHCLAIPHGVGSNNDAAGAKKLEFQRVLHDAVFLCVGMHKVQLVYSNDGHHSELCEAM